MATLSDSDYQDWLQKKGLNQPFMGRYGQWLKDVVHGELGRSLEKDIAVSTLLKQSLANTAVLAFFVFLIMIPVALTLGVLAGMNEGSALDRIISLRGVYDLHPANCHGGVAHRGSGARPGMGAQQVCHDRRLVVS